MAEKMLGSAAACVLPAEEVLRSLNSDAQQGLGTSEASDRLACHGSNELNASEQETMWAKFTEKLREPMIALLLASAGVSVLTGQYDDAISITLAVIIVIAVAVIQEHSSDQSLAALSKLAPHRAAVVRDGSAREVPATDLVPGDIVLLATGDRVPADVRLLEAVELHIDESSLTGETEPSVKSTAPVSPQAAAHRHTTSAGSSASAGSDTTPLSPGATAIVVSGESEVPVAERSSVAYMGSLVRSGRGRGVVTATGMSTELGHVCSMMDAAEERKSPLQLRMDALAQKLSFISFGIIGAIFLIGVVVQRKGWLDMFTIGVSLAVAAIPEGLPIVVTVTLALGVQRMAAKRAVVKKLPAVEALGCTSVLCVDKTGTLTRNEMTVVEAFSLVPPLTDSLAGGASTADEAAARDQLQAGLSSGAGAEPTLSPAVAAAAAAAIGGAGDAAAAAAAYRALHNKLGRGIGSRVLFRGLGYDARSGWAEYAHPHAVSRLDSSEQQEAQGQHSHSPHPPPLQVTAATAPHMGILAEVACVCNNASIRLESADAGSVAGGSSVAVPVDAATGAGAAGAAATVVGQPTEGALLVASAKLGAGDARASWTRTLELPFNSDTKVMTVRARRGAGLPDAAAAAASPAGSLVQDEQYFVKGSVDAVLAMCSGVLAPQGAAGGNARAASALLSGSAAASSAAAHAAAQSLPFTVAPVSPAYAATILAAAETLAREGLRVLALAKGDCIPSLLSSGASASAGATADSATGGLVFCGLVGLHDPPREGVIETIRQLRAGGVRVCMITGDGQATALAIAAHLGLVRELGHSSNGSSRQPSPLASPTVSMANSLATEEELGAEHEVDVDPLAASGIAISGAEVEAMSEQALADRIDNITVFYRTTPRHKMKIVRAYQVADRVVAMTGDGVNDAPALKVADIGVAMGRSGTDVAKEAADMVLTDDNLRTLLPAIEEGKSIFANIQHFVRFQLSTSVAALSLVAICTLLGLPNPLNAMQILFINILMDGPPAQSLGVEPVDPAVMRQPPRKRSDEIITRTLLQRIFLNACIIVIGTLWVFVGMDSGDTVATAGVVAADAPSHAQLTRRRTTLTFVTFVLFDMFNAVAARSSTRSILSVGLTSNKFFLYAVGGSVLGLLAVVYLPPLQAVFQTEAISVSDWLRLLGVSCSVLLVDEAVKGYARSRGGHGAEGVDGGSSVAMRNAAGFLSRALGSDRHGRNKRRADADTRSLLPLTGSDVSSGSGSS